MNRKIKVYIAGKITGNPYYKSEFDSIKQKLYDNGHIVLDPSELPLGMKKPDYMRICFPMIDTCDVAIFLGNYANSLGALLEKVYCEYIKKPYVILDKTNTYAKYWSWMVNNCNE